MTVRSVVSSIRGGATTERSFDAGLIAWNVFNIHINGSCFLANYIDTCCKKNVKRFKVSLFTARFSRF